MRVFAGSKGLIKWLDGTLELPDQATYPGAHYIWKINDGALNGFILGNISERDYRAVSDLQESHAVFEELRKCHALRLSEKADLFKKALDIRFNINTPLSETIHKIMSIHAKIANMGIMEPDYLKCIFLFSALGYQPEFHRVQIETMSAQDSPDFSSDTIPGLLHQEESLQLMRAAFGSVKGDRATKAICSICKSANHTVDFCIQPGGKMAGQSLDKARAAQRAASGKPPRQRRNRSSQPATGTPSASAETTSAQQIQTGTHTIVINGLSYNLVPSAVAPPQYQ